MPSYFSSCNRAPAGLVSAAVRATGAGRALPVLLAKVLVTELISVCEGLAGSELGMNSATVPLTHTVLPIAAAVGGALDVNTKMPSEVAGSPSPGEGICMKKPLDLRPVTMPLVVMAASFRGEAFPLP